MFTRIYKNKNLNGILIVFLLVVVTNFIQFDSVAKFNEIYLVPPKVIRHFTFGYNESLADSLWIRWIQSIDLCAKNEKINRKQFEKEHGIHSRKEMGVELPEELKGEVRVMLDSIEMAPRKDVCEGSWSFKLLDAITNLAPKFKMPYLVGGSTLSVLLEDHIGAKIIFKKGVQQYPNDWSILYRAAYHFLFELNDLETAARYMQRAAENGAPEWVHSLAARIYTKTGQIALGISTLEGYLKVIKNEERKKQVEQRIKLLKHFYEKQQKGEK